MPALIAEVDVLMLSGRDERWWFNCRLVVEISDMPVPVVKPALVLNLSKG